MLMADMQRRTKEFLKITKILALKCCPASRRFKTLSNPRNPEVGPRKLEEYPVFVLVPDLDGEVSAPETPRPRSRSVRKK